jgi:hypothetical protein
MNSLVAFAALATLTAQLSPPEQVDVDLSVAAGLGSLGSLGGVAQVSLRQQVWESPAVAGSLGVGLLAGYQAEDYTAYAPYFPAAEITGETHRFEALLVVGHDFRFLASRRLLLAVQFFGGWVQVAQRGTLKDSAAGVSGDYSADAGVLSTGLILRLGVRLTDRVSAVGRVLAPFPYATAVTPYVLFTVGVSVEL